MNMTDLTRPTLRAISPYIDKRGVSIRGNLSAMLRITQGAPEQNEKLLGAKRLFR